MPYIVICKKADGSIEVAAHPGEATPEMLQDAQPAASVEEAAQMARDVLGEGGGAEQPGGMMHGEGMDKQMQMPMEEGGMPMSMPGAEGMPMESREDQMAAGFKRARKGY